MAKQSKQAKKRSPRNDTDSKAKDTQAGERDAHRKRANPSDSWNSKIVFGVFAIVLVCGMLMVANRTEKIKQTTNKPQMNEAEPMKRKDKEKVAETVTSRMYKDFKPHILNELNIRSLNLDGTPVKVKALQHNHKESSVHAYVLENFLSPYECDSLAAVHDRHIDEISKLDPLLCFNSLKTFRQNLREVGMSRIKVSYDDFIQGTTCINGSLSSLLKNYMKWSYSTSFYPGESKFSLTLAERIKMVTGLSLENGGKFQITSYPLNIGYKNHTDCVEGRTEKRDRFATILIYLQDVPQGGETIFPKLGLKVTPRKGLALVWNSMNADGECDPSSIHNAAKVIKGHKYILQRWYYYQNFPSLGKRIAEPDLPPRKQNQPRVSCDQYEFGSCRWYDEWNYDHIVEYVQNQHKYV